MAAEHKDYASAARSIDETLEKTGLDYLDMMIIHSPQPWADFRGGDYAEGNREAWRALEDAYTAGKLWAIGVSNFKKPDLDNILSACRVKPMVNQILLHISNTDEELLEYCRAPGDSGGSLLPHCPRRGAEEPGDCGHGKEIRCQHRPALYPLCSGTWRGGTAKTANPEHMKTNAEVDFTIAPAGMEILKHTVPH